MPYPTSSSASDVWSLKSLYVAVAGNNWPTIGLPDPNFNQVSLLLNGDGTDGGQNNTYTDSSSNGHTITPSGTIEQGSVSPFGDNWSNFFDGGVGGDNLVLANTGTTIGTGDFTIEGWFYFNGIGAGSVYTLLDGRTGADTSNLMWAQESNGQWVIQNGAGSSIDEGWTTTTFTEGQWYHIAQSRTAGTSRFFVNGVLTGSPADSSSYDSQQYTIGGRYAPNGSNLTGYLSNFRIVAGTALYTTNFTPPAAPLTNIAGTLVLTCQSNRFADNSTNAFTITVSGTPEVTSFSPFANSKAITLANNGGSAHFDGTSSYLSIADDSSLEVGPNDFTLECWFYSTASSYSNAGIAGKWDVVAGFRSYAIYMDTSNRLTFGISNSGSFESSNVLNSSITSASLRNRWNHIRGCKSGTTLYLFLNGISIGSKTVSSTVFSGTQNFYVGKINVNIIQGYVSNVRLINGTALSTSNFTPPTEPLTAVTNTSLLLNFADAAIFDYAALNNLGTIGSADISTSVVKYGTGSLAFDGTSDYLETPNKSELVLAGAPWTVECWVRPDGNYSSYNTIFAKRVSGSTTTSYEGFLNISTGVVSFYNGTTYLSSTTLASDVWSHCAWVYDGTNINMYVNGVSVLSTAVTISEVDTEFVIGGARGYSEWFYGYIDDFRITKGLARYTSTFTPPTEALPTF